MKITLIGGGVMGEAMIKGVLGKKVAQPGEIVVHDVDLARLKALAKAYAVVPAKDYGTALKDAEVVILAVKPQNLPQLMPELKSRLVPGQLVLSIVAGADIATIVAGLGHNSVVRAMPNTPGQIGEGVTVWTASHRASHSHKEMARSILGALGREIYVRDEKYIDMATAVSGSGPAYIFLVMEALIDAGVHIGLPREMAGELVLQTLLGSGRLAQETGRSPAELRNMVTSPGGTTAEGLLQLEEGGLRALLAHAVIAAYEKAKILGG